MEIRPYELMSKRVLMNKSRMDIAKSLGMKISLYYKKERGYIKFSDDEKILLSKILNMTFEEWNNIFYDGMLPWG